MPTVAAGDGWHVVTPVVVSTADPAKLGQLISATFNMHNMRGGGCNTASASVDGVINGFDTSVSTGIACPASGAQGVLFDWSYFFDYKEDTYRGGRGHMYYAGR